MSLFFYYPTEIDYMGFLDDYQNTDEYAKCKETCDELRYDRSKLKEYKTCLKNCNVEANNPDKVIAKLTKGAAGDPLAGIIYTEVFKKELTATQMNEKNLMLVKEVNTTLSPSDLDVVDVTLEDLFSPHARLNGKTLCARISEATNQTLSAVSYTVNGSANPRYVEAECIDIHAKIQLGKVISRDASNIMYLLEDTEYDMYCKSQNTDKWIGKLDAATCEKVAPWMKFSDTEAPVSVCKLNKGTLSNSCEVNTAQRDKIKSYLRKKINNCISEMGCLTDTTGEDRTQGKFMRRHTAKNFSKSTPTQICCKRSLQASVKGVMRMNRIYKFVGNLSYDEQMALINKSSMTDEEKKLFVQGVQDSHNIGEKLVEQLNLDRPTQIMMESFSIIVRNAIKEQFEQFVQLNTVGESKTDAAAEKKLQEIMGDEEKAGFVMRMLKSAATSVASAIFEVTKMILKTIKYFAKKSFDLLTWIFHHPTTAMWLAYSALFLKKKCCEMISLRIYGSPEIIEVGLFGKGSDLLKTSSDYAAEMATMIKKSFLAKTYDFIGSSSFSSYLSGLSTLIEHGILYVLALIPGIGVPIATTIKMSGGLTIIMNGLAQVMGEAMYYGMTAIVLKEAGGDMYAIITGTCIKKPEALKQFSAAGVMGEVSSAGQAVGQTVTSAGQQVLSTTVSAASFAAEQTNGFFSHLYNMMPAVTGFNMDRHEQMPGVNIESVKTVAAAAISKAATF